MDCARSTRGAGPGISSSWRVEPSSPPGTWTIEEYTIGHLVSVRPYRGSFDPVGVAHKMTLHIEPLAAQARPVRMLDRPSRPVGAVHVLILVGAGRRELPAIQGDTSWGGNSASK